MKKSKSFKVGDKVFAKVKGYPAWPAHVSAVDGKKYKVVFYGTDETATLKAEDLFYYLKHKHSLIKPNRRRDYKEALYEIKKAVERDGTDGNIDDTDDSTPDVSVASLNTSSSKTEKRKRSVSKTDEEQPAKKLNSDADNANENDVNEKDEDTNAKSDITSSGNSVDTDGESNKNKQPDSPITITAPPESKKSQNIKLVSENDLNSYIAYAEYVRKHEDLFKGKEEEPRDDAEIFPVKLSSGKIVALKLHKTWPLNCKNEYERALYDEKISKDLLQLKEQLQSSGETNSELFVEDFQLTENEINKIFVEQEVAKLTERSNKLQSQSEIAQLDTKIKACLALDKADPKAALQYLDKMLDLDVTRIMLLKLPHIVEGIRRLRNYVGNTEEWNLTEDSLVTFQCDADKVRFKAEEVWKKMQKIVKLEKSPRNFWEGYNELVSNFREKTEYLSEHQIDLILTEPHCRQFFMEMYEDKLRKTKNNNEVTVEPNCDVEAKTE